jgi:hypothetical protein
LLITIRTEYAEMSEIVWKKLYKISKIIENLKSDRPKSKPFSCQVLNSLKKKVAIEQSSAEDVLAAGMLIADVLMLAGLYTI